jgi:hypothetical protein
MVEVFADSVRWLSQGQVQAEGQVREEEEAKEAQVQGQDVQEEV